MNVDNDRNGQGALPDEQETVQDLNEQRLIRREKLAALQAMGRNPYLVETWDVDAWSRDVKRTSSTWRKTGVRGRAHHGQTAMGKAAFIDIGPAGPDSVVRRIRHLLTLRPGGHRGRQGEMFHAPRRISIRVDTLRLLTKSRRCRISGAALKTRSSAPSALRGSLNPDVRDTFLAHDDVNRKVLGTTAISVDTPILTVIAGGANARPFSTTTTLDLEMKLRISNELYLRGSSSADWTGCTRSGVPERRHGPESQPQVQHGVLHGCGHGSGDGCNRTGRIRAALRDRRHEITTRARSSIRHLRGPSSTWAKRCGR